MSENCEIYRELNGGYVFIKAYLEPDVRRSFYPYSLYTTEEQQSIKHLNLIVESPYGIKHEWRPFEEIIKIMENLELFNE